MPETPWSPGVATTACTRRREPGNAQFTHVWTLRDGKILKFQQYTDTAQVAKAIGGSLA